LFTSGGEAVSGGGAGVRSLRSAMRGQWVNLNAPARSSDVTPAKAEVHDLEKTVPDTVSADVTLAKAGVHDLDSRPSTGSGQAFARE
jgi:hypothetical protein